MSAKTSVRIPDWVQHKMVHYCAYQERCMSDVTTKIKEFKLQERIEETLIAYLIKENYLNEERFARVYAGGKFRINKWGKNKIYRALQEKKVPELFILEALNEIDKNEYLSTLKNLIAKKSRELKETNIIKRNKKLATFAASKGFENNLIWDVLNFRG